MPLVHTTVEEFEALVVYVSLSHCENSFHYANDKDPNYLSITRKSGNQ